MTSVLETLVWNIFTPCKCCKMNTIQLNSIGCFHANIYWINCNKYRNIHKTCTVYWVKEVDNQIIPILNVMNITPSIISAKCPTNLLILQIKYLYLLHKCEILNRYSVNTLIFDCDNHALPVNIFLSLIWPCGFHKR